MKQFCGRIAREDVTANFMFQLFKILKYILDAFQNKVSICSMSQNITPHYIKRKYS
jgi:hypothetical protein